MDGSVMDNEEDMMPDEEEERAKERFFASADTSDAVLIPQCEECPHNKGLMNCAIFKNKPAEYLYNVLPCSKSAV